MTEQVLFAFSGGKDSCLALQQVIQDPNLEVAALLVTLTEDYRRISMHGVQEVLLDQQGASIGLALEKVWIPASANNDTYETRMHTVLEKYKRQGVNRVVFGDIFLEDIRAYRERQLGRAGMQALFPLWGQDTGELAARFVASRFKGIICCVDSQALGKEFAGREMNPAFFQCLPDTVDPCGENGEFHSFVHDGPIFNQPVAVTTGDIVLRDQRFYYCELNPGEPIEKSD